METAKTGGSTRLLKSGVEARMSSGDWDVPCRDFARVLLGVVDVTKSCTIKGLL